MVERQVGVLAGWFCPLVQIQITPFEFGLAVACSKRHVAVQVGPLAVRIDWHSSKFRVEAFNE